MSSSLLYCLGRVRRVKAKPHAVAARALTRRLPLEDGRRQGGRGRTRTRSPAWAGPRFAGPLAGH